MDYSANTLLTLGLILFFGLFLPLMFQRFHLPFSTALILLGALLGPFGMDSIQLDATLQFFGLLGAALLMLLAGFEFTSIRPDLPARKSIVLLLVSGGLPAVTGTAIALLAGYGWLEASFVGAIFLSSSIMLAFSFTSHIGIEQKPLGKILKWIVMSEDLLSALLVLVLFKMFAPHPRFPLTMLIGLLVSAVVLLRMFLPEVVTYLFQKVKSMEDNHEGELRFLLALVLLVIFMFSVLEVHPVISAFLVGFSLSGLPNVEAVRKKLQTVAYAVFIPVFLFVVGLETDLLIFVRPGQSNLFFISLVTGAILSKIIGGFVAGKMLHFSHRESLIMGVGISPKLMVSLSLSFAALHLGVVDKTIFSAIIFVSVVSSTITPIAMSFLHPAKTGPAGD